MAFAELSGGALLQSFVGAGFDRRLFIIGGEIAAAMERVPTQEGRGSVLYGGAPVPWSPTETQRALGLAAAQHLKLEVAGVDLIRDADGNDLILEVNSAPGFAAIETVTSLDLAGQLADFTLRCCGLR